MGVESRLLSKDQDTGIETWHHYDDATDETRVETRQDCSSILDYNKFCANDTDLRRKGIKNSWWKFATIPNVLIDKWRIEMGINVFDPNDLPKVKRLLMDPDYRFLKTTVGRL